MIGAIGQGGGSELARAAIEAALRSQADAASKIGQQAPAAPGLAPAGEAKGFADALVEGMRATGQELARVERLPVDVLTGKAGDFHEVAALLKQSELTFKFALEVRNKLIDAYRETMRMSV